MHYFPPIIRIDWCIYHTILIATFSCVLKHFPITKMNCVLCVTLVDLTEGSAANPGSVEQVAASKHYLHYIVNIFK